MEKYALLLLLGFSGIQPSLEAARLRGGEGRGGEWKDVGKD